MSTAPPPYSCPVPILHDILAMMSAGKISRPRMLVSTTYDGSNRILTAVVRDTLYGFNNDITYTWSGWGTATVTITGSDGSVKTMTLDGSSRLASFSPVFA